jgi:hypothetical protein
LTYKKPLNILHATKTKFLSIQSMDMSLHVVDRREDGIVVRGAKLHNTMAPYADELIVIPTRALNKDEKDYAVAFAIPADTDGVYLIARDAFSVKREPGMEAPYNDFGDIEVFRFEWTPATPGKLKASRPHIAAGGHTRVGSEIGVLEDGALARQCVEVGSLNPVVAVTTEVVAAQGVNDDEDGVHGFSFPK